MTERLDLVAKTSGVSLKNVCKVAAALQLVSEYYNNSLEELVYQDQLDSSAPTEKQMAYVESSYNDMVSYFDQAGNGELVANVRKMEGSMFKDRVF
jgi:hypothetical protein